MNKILEWTQINFPHLVRVFLFVIAGILILMLFPRETGFYRDFSQARPWMHDDLIAPFDFAIQKSPTELAREQEQVLSELTPFFTHDRSMYDQQFPLLINRFEQAWFEKHNQQNLNTSLKEQKKKLIISIFDSIYNTGIIFLEGELVGASPETEVLLLEGNIAVRKKINDFLTIREAFQVIGQILSEKESIAEYSTMLRQIIESSIAQTIFLDEQANLRARATALERISPTRGMIQQGEKIVSKGEIITAEKYNILESFKNEYQRQLGPSSLNYLLLAGQFILVAVALLLLAVFLYIFKKEVFLNPRKLLVIFLSLYLIIFLISYISRIDGRLIYLVPVVIAPVIIRSFFDNRLSLYVHIITTLLMGFLIPKQMDIVFLQFIAGMVAILSIAHLRRRSQLFATAFLVFLSYSAIYTGLLLAQSGNFTSIEPVNYLYFAGSALLTLFSYPLIFIFERTSGLPTDFSLLELADTNSTLLRQLNMEAPGTFQHSLQVANLAEEAINIIGGNSLLVRTGALYHDIGKMEQPQYFIENQISDINIHDDLSFQESAEIIIGHVLKGIEKARKHNLPEYIIDFIRTHHGTTTTRYFYAMEKKENPDKEINPEVFRYKGPEPFSKETAVVMMADSVEAASRSLKKPTEETLSQLVDNIIDTQLHENQFDNANITLKDIVTVKRVFKNRLMHIFHVRVAYPSLN